MQLHRLAVLVVIVAAGCSESKEAQVTEDRLASAVQNEALMRQVLDLIDERELDAAFELYAADYIYHGPGGRELRGRDGIRGLWEVFLTGFPDLSSTVDDIYLRGGQTSSEKDD